MTTMMTPVILCGGSGTRLWPLSRKAYPKQLLTLSGPHSMLQETVLRLAMLPELSPPIVICHDRYRFVVAEQLLEIGAREATIILEPCSKNTAPAAAIAALSVSGVTDLLVVPADHQIANHNPFFEAIACARKYAAQGFLVTFGIPANRPETGYGYIKKGIPVEDAGGHAVEAFVEKPNAVLATQYVESEEYYWNSGMFIFRAAAYLKELQQFSPEMVTICEEAVRTARKDLDFVRLDETQFCACPSDSIDYAVMEKSKQVVVVPLVDSGWSDLGSWDAVYETQLKDPHNNVVIGDVHTEQVTDSYLHSEGRLLAVVGVSDHIIINTDDAVLVAHKNAAQAVKKIVNQLEAKKRHEMEYHRRVYRPWGYYDVMESAPLFQVKRIVVKPGASLSLQMHRFRSEHWIVIQGIAEVICGEKQFILEANQSTYIPALQKHRLRNSKTHDLVLIEVQTGSYLGEDDIVRFEDHYGREVEPIT